MTYQEVLDSMSASARSIGSRGYKSLIVHANGRTEVIGTSWRPTQEGRDMRISRAAPVMSREQALEWAKRTIEQRARARTVSDYRLEQAKLTGVRPTEQEALKALFS